MPRTNTVLLQEQRDLAFLVQFCLFANETVTGWLDLIQDQESIELSKSVKTFESFKMLLTARTSPLDTLNFNKEVSFSNC